MKIYKHGFTLVELIVVITILSVLSTIGFISYQGYSLTSRDSVRLADMASLDKGLSVLSATAVKLPFPADYIEISASGTLINYQGDAGIQVMGKIGVSNGGVDPIDNRYYTYITNANRTKYQLLGYFEKEMKYTLNKNIAIADGLFDRFPVLRGSKLGVLVDSVTNIPVHTENVNIDIINTSNEYSIIIEDNNINITGTGNVLFSSLYISNQDIKTNVNLAALDKSLVLSLDMESIIDDGGNLKIRDDSGYNNHGLCYNNGFVQCGNNVDGLDIVEGKIGKALMFDESIADNYTYHIDSPSLDIKTNEVTIAGWLKLNKNIQDFVNTYPTFLMKRPFNVGGYGSHFSKTSGGMNIQYCYSGGSNSLYYYGGLPVGEWFHYAGVKSKEKFEIYINGQLVDSSSVNENLTIGSSAGYSLTVGNAFQGSIDEVKVYNRALNSYEVLDLYN